MKTKVIERNGVKLRVSVNNKTRVATFTTYFKDGKVFRKYRTKLDRAAMQYYPDYATANDWFTLFHNSDLVRVK